MIEILSIELTNLCSKGCWFCYNHSGPDRANHWDLDELLSFINDAVQNGTKAVSFGGGEPLQYPHLLELIKRLKGLCSKSITTNGALLTDDKMDELKEAWIDKIHVSIHFPENNKEVEFVIQKVKRLEEKGIVSGINLVVAQSKLEETKEAVLKIHAAGIDNKRIIFLPMRIHDEPTPKEIGSVSNGPFQSTSCLMECGKSKRFVSVDAQKRAAWCSYTETRKLIEPLNSEGLKNALNGLGLKYCGAD